jgi:hypothetical protein
MVGTVISGSGTIVPTSASELAGTSTNFQIDAASGWYISTVTSNASDVSPSSPKPTSLTMNVLLDGAKTYAVTFAQYSTITATFGANGSGSPASVANIEQGGSAQFTYSADSFYHVSDVVSNGSSVGTPASPYTMTGVTTDGTFSVAFAANLGANLTPEYWYNGVYGLSDDNTDADGDGQLTSQEYQTGTSPIDRASVLKETSTTVAGGIVTVSWQSTTNNPSGLPGAYRVDRAANLQSGGWSVVGSDIPRVEGTQTYQEAASTTTYFYRVVYTNSF